jgi:hypothetical protein
MQASLIAAAPKSMVTAATPTAVVPKKRVHSQEIISNKCVCAICSEDVPGDQNWRLFGNKCKHCDCFVHLGCQKTSNGERWQYCVKCQKKKRQ